MHAIRYAWEQVSQSTIKNCFAKAKFIDAEIQTEPDANELLEIWEALPAEEKRQDNEQIELTDYLEADDRLAAGGSLSLEEIAVMVGNKEMEQEDVNSNDADTIEEECISFQDAQRASATLRKFMQQRNGVLDEMQACDRIDKEMHEIRKRSNRQLTILECFGHA